MSPILLLNLFLYFAFIYKTFRNPQNITSDFLVMEDYKGFFFLQSLYAYSTMNVIFTITIQ